MQRARLRELGLDVPAPTAVVEEIVEAGLLPTNTPTVYTVEQAAALLTQTLAGSTNNRQAE